MSRAIVHFDERGEISFHVEGDVRLLIIDERVPDDRVYEVTDRSTPSEIDAIVRDDKIGNRFDGKLPTERLQ